MTLLIQSMTAEIEALLEAKMATDRHDAFPLERIADIVEWSGPISPGVRARAIIGLHSVNVDASFSEACADAIAATPDWQALLTMLLNDTHVGPQTITTASRVLSRHMPGHILSDSQAGKVRVVKICDAIDDGTVLRTSQAAWVDLGEGPCALVGLADPITQIARGIATFDTSGVAINPGLAEWLERDRLACPAFLAVAI